MTILMMGRNVINWIDKSIQSAIDQDYDNFEIICIDACSTDGTFERLKEYERQHENVTVIQNQERKFQIENIVIGTNMAKDESIICHLDFDDWYENKNVLARINAEYNKKDIWVSFGSYVEHPYRDVKFHYSAYPKEIVDNRDFRTYKWLATHVRTYRKELFLKINQENLKDENRNYFEVCGDLAFQYCLLEMAGDRHSYIPDILYVYNRTNPESESNIYAQKIEQTEKYIRSMAKYEKIEQL